MPGSNKTNRTIIDKNELQCKTRNSSLEVEIIGPTSLNRGAWLKFKTAIKKIIYYNLLQLITVVILYKKTEGANTGSCAKQQGSVWGLRRLRVICRARVQDERGLEAA